MLVDIHTHNSKPSEIYSIQNLNFAAAEIILSSNAKGFYSVGFHPWCVDEFSQEMFSKLENWSKDNRLLAIGECGLDKNSKASIALQLEIFKLQISLSEQVQKPLIIHCVGCFNELFEVKKQLNPQQRWIIHGFRGKPELASQVLKSGCSISFGEHFNAESVRLTPTDKLFVETDESSLSIEEIYQRISETKQCSPNDLNAGKQLFQSFLEQFSSLNR